MTAKYTPGPWNAYGSEGEFWVESLSALEGEVPSDICALKLDDPSAEANARLIAAAPDMLEALQFAVRWINQTCDNADDEGTSVDTLASGRPAALKPLLAAIAKAEGR